jgi:hypothetical protein
MQSTNFTIHPQAFFLPERMLTQSQLRTVVCWLQWQHSQHCLQRFYARQRAVTSLKGLACLNHPFTSFKGNEQQWMDNGPAQSDKSRITATAKLA